MSLDGLRTLLSDQAAQAERTNQRQANQEQQVRQGSGAQGSQVTLSISSQSFVSARILSGSFNQNLSVGNFRPNFTIPEQEEPSSLFDFEEVARNVLRFVGGVITGARDSGVDEEELNSLFEQARSGVAQGISLAERDLGGLLNDEISEGIENSRNRIEEGLQALEQEIFNPQPSESDDNLSQVSISQSLQAASQNSGELTIRTRDGDEVFVSFDSLRALQIDRSILLEEQNESQEAPQTGAIEDAPQNTEQAPDVTSAGNGTNNDETNSVRQSDADINNSELSDGAIQTNESNSDEIDQSNLQPQSNSTFLQRDEFTLSITGELDEGELESIGSLLNDVTDLADEFFNGDVEVAFNQALELGFDDEELVGFALQLNQVQQVQVVETYQSVAQFTDDEQGATRPEARLENVSNYLQQLQNVFNPDAIIEPQSIDDFVRELVGRVLNNDEANRDSDINRFNQFNQRLLNNLP